MKKGRMRFLLVIFLGIFLISLGFTTATTTACNSCSDCQAKILAASDNDIIQMSENITFNSSNCINTGGTSGGNVTFDGNGNWIIGNRTSDYWGVYINHDNFTVKNTSFLNGSGVYALPSRKNINIEDNYFEDIVAPAVRVESNYTNVLRNVYYNISTGYSYANLIYGTASHVVFSGNNATLLGKAFAYFRGFGGFLYNLTITDNIANTSSSQLEIHMIDIQEANTGILSGNVWNDSKKELSYLISISGFNISNNNRSASGISQMYYTLRLTLGCDNNVTDDNYNLDSGKPVKYYGNQDGLFVEDLDNYSSLLLCNVSNSIFENITINNSPHYLDGVHIDSSHNVTIRNSNIIHPFIGIYLTHNNSDIFILNNTIMDTKGGEKSPLIYMNPCRDNGGTYGSLNGTYIINNTLYNASAGMSSVFFFRQENENCSIENTHIYENNITSDDGTNFIYYDLGAGAVQSSSWFFNTTLTIGSSLWNQYGSYLGGNFWGGITGSGFSQICTDSDEDGICDSLYDIDSEGLFYDYLPISNYVNTTDVVAPSISSISSPSDWLFTIQNRTLFNFSVGEESLENVTFNYGGSNFSLCGGDLLMSINFENYSGSSIYDEADCGSVRTWTSLNSPNITASPIDVFYSNDYGSFMDFGGVDRMYTSDNIAPTDEMTLEVWFYQRPHVSLGTIIRGGRSSAPYYTYRLYTNTGNDISFRLSNATGTEVIRSNTINQNQWYHFVGVYNGTHVLIYLNGTLVSTDALNGVLNVPNSGVYLGDDTGNRFYNGSLDEIKIYNRSFTADEVQELYSSKRGRFYYDAYNQSYGDYSYTLYAVDNSSNAASYGSYNYRITPIAINLSAPANNSGNSDENLSFVFNFTNVSSVLNCSVILDDVLNSTFISPVSGANNILNVSGLSAGKYLWNLNCTDSNGEMASSKFRIFSIIKASLFSGDSTDISSVNISNISNFVLQNSYGSINFSESVDLSDGADLDNYVDITNNYISINTSALPDLNKSADLTFYGLTFTDPVILVDGETCPDSICTELSYSGGTFIFSVTHFLNYSVEETPQSTTATTATTDSTTSSGSGIGTYKPSKDVLENGYTTNVVVGQKVQITFDGQMKYVEIKSVSDDKVVVSVDGKDYEIKSSASGKIDLDSNGVYDLQISISNVYRDIATLEFKLINEKIPSEAQEGQEESIVDSGNLPMEKIGFWKKIGNFFSRIWDLITFWN